MRSDSLDLMRDFVRMQQCLCKALLKRFSTTTNLLLGIPRNGSVVAEDAFWEFQRHGNGINFVQSATGIQVDVTDHFDHPEAIDAWRLVTYFESLGLETVCYQDRTFMADDAGIRDLIAELIASNKLEKISHEHKLFRFVTV